MPTERRPRWEGRETLILRAANSEKAARCNKHITSQPAFIDAALIGPFSPHFPYANIS